MNTTSITTLAQVLDGVTPGPSSINYKVALMLISQAETLLQLARDVVNADDVTLRDTMIRPVNLITRSFDDAMDTIGQIVTDLCDLPDIGIANEAEMEKIWAESAARVAKYNAEHPEEAAEDLDGEDETDLLQQVFNQFQGEQSDSDEEAAQDLQRDQEAQAYKDLQARMDEEGDEE